MTKEINEIILSVIRRDTARGIGYDKVRNKEVRYPKGVDLVDTGFLMGSAIAKDNGIVWIAAYAKDVNKRFPFNAISPKQKAEIIKLIKPLIAKNIIKQGSK
jgi:hypothetical protein